MAASAVADDFARRFAEAWSSPTPDRLLGLLTDDVELAQPLTPTTRGKAQARTSLSRLLALIPDLHAEVRRHWGDERQVAIEFELVGTLGGRPLRWGVVDVLDLDGELARRRRAYFDPLPLALALLGRPRAWIRFARSGIWRR